MPSNWMRFWSVNLAWPCQVVTALPGQLLLDAARYQVNETVLVPHQVGPVDWHAARVDGRDASAVRGAPVRSGHTGHTGPDHDQVVLRVISRTPIVGAHPYRRDRRGLVARAAPADRRRFGARRRGLLVSRCARSGSLSGSRCRSMSGCGRRRGCDPRCTAIRNRRFCCPTALSADFRPKDNQSRPSWILLYVMRYEPGNSPARSRRSTPGWPRPATAPWGIWSSCRSCARARSAGRDSAALTRRLCRARFEEQTTLESFDFTANPKGPAAQIRDLVALRWAWRRRVGACSARCRQNPCGVGPSPSRGAAAQSASPKPAASGPTWLTWPAATLTAPETFADHRTASRPPRHLRPRLEHRSVSAVGSRTATELLSNVNGRPT